MNSPSPDYAEKMFRGLSVVSEMFSGDIDRVGPVLSQIALGVHREELLVMCYFKAHNKLPISPRDLEDSEAVSRYNVLVANVKGTIQGIFRLASEEERAENERNLAQLRARLRNSNKPDPMGTVSELATKFNKSKSEIRRLKAAGLLYTLTEEQSS